MKKKLDVQGISVTLEVNGALPIVYRELFGRDLLMDEAKISRYGTSIEDFSFSEIYDIVYSMAYLAGTKLTQIEWYSRFPLPAEMFSLWKEAMALLRGDIKTSKK